MYCAYVLALGQFSSATSATSLRGGVVGSGGPEETVSGGKGEGLFTHPCQVKALCNKRI